MHHQNASCSFVAPIEFIGKAQVKGKMVLAPGVQLPCSNSVKSFRALFVAFPDLRAQGAGVVANGIGLEKTVGESFTDPYLKLFFFFENSDKNRIAQVRVHFLHFTNQFRGNAPVCFLGGRTTGDSSLCSVQMSGRKKEKREKYQGLKKEMAYH